MSHRTDSTTPSNRSPIPNAVLRIRFTSPPFGRKLTEQDLETVKLAADRATAAYEALADD
jgi:hypothetical protein